MKKNLSKIAKRKLFSFRAKRAALYQGETDPTTTMVTITVTGTH